MTALPDMPRGTRFYLALADGTVVYRGTALPEGFAEMDVVDGQGVEPQVWPPKTLAEVYDTAVHTFGTIGTVV